MDAHANHDHAATPTLRGMKRVAAGVAASHPATARAGLQVLRDGGTAADAAVAAVLACCVAETIFTGLGGGGFATYFEAATGTVTCLDFFVAVPGTDGGREAGAMMSVGVFFGGLPQGYFSGGGGRGGGRGGGGRGRGGAGAGGG